MLNEAKNDFYYWTHFSLVNMKFFLLALFLLIFFFDFVLNFILIQTNEENLTKK